MAWQRSLLSHFFAQTHRVDEKYGAFLAYEYLCLWNVDSLSFISLSGYNATDSSIASKPIAPLTALIIDPSLDNLTLLLNELFGYSVHWQGQQSYELL